MKGGITLVLNCLRSGGAEKQLLWIAAEIVAMGMRCQILELMAGERTERIEAMIRSAVAQGVQVLRAPSGGGILGGAWRLHRHLARNRPDLVWSWGFRADTLCLLNRLAGAGGRWLISIRCSVPRLGWKTRWLQAVLAAHCDGVVSNTHAGLVTTGMTVRPRLRRWVLPNAVRFDPVDEIVLPDAPPDRLVVVMLGNIKIRHKGYDLVAGLVRSLQEKAVAVEFRVAGRPDELPEFETSLRQAGVQPAVSFYGEVSHPEEFLRTGHLYLLLSRFEGMPNTLLEALNVGLPAVATSVGDLAALKAAGAPYDLIPVEDVVAAAAAITRSLARWEETRQRAVMGRPWVQANFSEAACRQVLRRILAEVLPR